VDISQMLQIPLSWWLLGWRTVQRGTNYARKQFGTTRVKAAGFFWFPDRAALTKQYPYLGDRLDGHSIVWALWPVGANFFDDGKNTHLVKRLILPDPGSDSAIFYFNSISQDHALSLIKSTTLKAQKIGASVRWSSHFPFNSITLVDPQKPSGWAHLETALPYCTTIDRAGYTIYKHRSAEAVDRLATVFQEIWDRSSEPRDGSPNLR
jgi:hypothetical protein